MSIDISVKIGGEAGQGIQTVGQLLSLVCQKAGLYIMAINDFESRIRGGHSFFQIRISDRPVNAPHSRIDLLVGLDQRSLDLHRGELTPEGSVLIGEADESTDPNVSVVPYTLLARQAGGRILTNTVAAGSCLALLGAPYELCKTVFAAHFQRRGKDLVEKNLRAAELGFDAVKDIAFSSRFPWQLGQPRGAILEGSKAIALGALAGDCRMAAFYPMSPGTAIMRHLSQLSDHFPLVVEQAEDEIAAANMAIGASFAGVRSMTSTSGGGFCLMTEALGLAGITETPLVIVNAQRPGPATGLPTRTAQGDLQFVIRASQDEFPRFVFAPGTPVEAFDMTARAFYLSDKYQVPVIILVDQYLNDSLFIAEEPLEAPDHVAHFTVQDSDMDNPSAYKRFSLEESGISPRALPCQGDALVLVTGNEHSDDGHISEAIADRVNMVEKRQAKLKGMQAEMSSPKAYHGAADFLLVGWGSTAGAIRESVDILRDKGIDAGCLMFSDIWPFPVNDATSALGKGKRRILVEQNSTGQLGQLIREQTGIACTEAILKYDGRPLYPLQIVDKLLALGEVTI